MDNLEYSVEARNILNFFYGVEKIVYVEGEDDILFWELVFEKIADFKVEVEAVGGKQELLKHVAPIMEDTADYIIAMDSDYDAFIDVDAHPNIIKTVGYSIENTLITSESICRIIKSLARLSSKDMPKESCSFWFDDLNIKVKNMVLIDIFNELNGYGVKVIPDNSDRFMKSKKSSEPCSDKIQNYIDQLSIPITDGELVEIDKIIKDFGLSYCEILRGHFLFSALQRFVKTKVKELGKDVSISTDMLYSNIIAVFDSVFNENHPHFEYYRAKLSVA